MKRFTLSFLAATYGLIFTLQSFALTLDEFTTTGEAVVGSATPTTASTNIIAGEALGGSRLLFISRTSPFDAGAKAKIRTENKLFHDQDSGVLAFSRVTWDKDSNPANPVDPQGLGSIDFTQDGGDSFNLKISFDSNPTGITLKFFDSNDSSGGTLKQINFTVNQGMTNFDLVIPFSLLNSTGPVSLVGPGGSTIPGTVFTSIPGIDTLKRVGAVVLEINGQLAESDISIDFLKTNGKCTAVPDTDGKVINDCGICKEDPLYLTPKDDCGYCPNDIDNYKNYSVTKDKCLNCLNSPTYIPPDLQCGRCPNKPNYNTPPDPCGVCDGDGTSCADCSGNPNGSAKYDICNVCNGNGTTCLDCAGTPFGKLTLDACKVCGGTTTDPAKCSVTEQCQTVEASAEIIEFEKRLVEQATTLVNKYKGERNRNKVHSCGINTLPADKKIMAAYATIKKLGEKIFNKGVEVCGENCVTVSFAEEVIATLPVLKVIEKETKSMAKKVQSCYKRKKIKTAQKIAGVETTINQVKKDLTQLIKDCKDTEVCPK